jgi:proline dehydrogenase
MGLMRAVLLAGSQNAWLRDRAMRYPFVRQSVSRFMPGETLDAALEAARGLAKRSAGTVLTHLGENISEAAEAETVTAHYLDVLGRVQADGLDAQISVKPTQLGLDLDLDTCFRHLMTLVERAATHGNFVWIDMESTKYVDLTLDLFRRARSASPRIGVCLQAYLRRTAVDLESLLPLGPAIRLVKGAYREPASLAFPNKSDVDENFYDLASRLLEDDAQRAGAMVAIATHDETLIERLRRLIAGRAVRAVRHAFAAGAPHPGAGSPPGAAAPPTGYEFEMLFGIQPRLQARLLEKGQPLRVLISYGEFWFPWYMRRLAERPANVWFVARNMFAR